MSAFADLAPVARLMDGYAHPWYVAGGWAIDRWLGRVTREHEDVDIAVLRADQAALRRHLAGWDLRKVVMGPAGGVRAPWQAEEWLAPPVHEIHAWRAVGEVAALEVLLNESDGELWRYRRNVAIARPLARMGLRAADGLPVLAPEIALLYKAKGHGPKDDQDFDNAHGQLDEEPRRWLRQALGICHPEHP